MSSKRLKRERTSGWRMIGILILALSCVAAWAKPATTYYEVKMKTQHGAGVQIVKLWKSGNYYKQEIMGGAKGKSMVQILNKDGFYTVLEWANTAVKYPGNPSKVAHPYLPGPVGDIKTFLKTKGAVSKGKKSLDGAMCEVWQYHEKASKRTCSLWINQKTGQPAQLIVANVPADQDPLRSYKDIQIWAVYQVYKTGVAIPDSAFKISAKLQAPKMTQ